MKKMLSLFVLTVISGLLFAGNPPKKMPAKLDKGESSDAGSAPIRSKINESVLIGNSVNSYAWQGSGTNQIYYDVASGTIAVVKRRGSLDTAIPVGAGQIVTHQSADQGSVWSLGNHVNATLPHQNGRHPNVAILPSGEIITLWNDIYNGTMFGILGIASTNLSDGTLISAYLDSTLSAEIDENPGSDEAIYGVQDEIFVDEKNNTFYFGGNAVNYPNTLFLFKSTDKGQSHQLVKLWKNVYDSGQIADVSTTHGDFFGDIGYFIAQVLPDSAWAVENGLTPNVLVPYLVQFQNGSIADEGFLDLSDIFTSLGIDSWTYEWDVVTDKDGNWHMFIHGYLAGGTEDTHVGIYEIFSTSPGLTSVSAKKVADITLVECEIDALNNLYGAADIHAARDAEGKYVFVKYLDWDPADSPETSTEMFVTGRAISRETYSDPIAVNDNDFANQFFTQAAPRVTALGAGDAAGTKKFQIHSSWVEFGGTPVSGLAAANLYYAGPNIDLPDYYNLNDSATVTFKVNTAFVQDTLSAGSSVSIRGSAFGGDWSLAKGIKFKNVGGDYWEAKKTVFPGQSGGIFKIVTATQSGTGWDRHEIAQFEIKDDTTITYFTTGLTNTYPDPVTGAEITRGDDWDPLEIAKEGTTGKVAVHFRVNMQPRDGFNPAQHEVQVRGGFNDWGGNTKLYPEVRYDDMDATTIYDAPKYFFSRTVLIDAASIGSELKYKFTYTDPSTQWESIQDRVFNLSGDTTLYWKWFDNYYICECPPYGSLFNVSVKVNLEKAINTNGFNPQTDTLIARVGFLGTAWKTVDVKLVPPPLGTVYIGDSGLDSLRSLYSNVVFYQYFKKNVTGEYEEFYFDYFNTKPNLTATKYRKVFMPNSGTTVFIEDLETDKFSMHRQPVFKNYTPMADSTRINFEVDFSPLFYFVNELGDSLTGGWSTGDPLYVSGKNISSLPFELVIRQYCDVCIGLPISPISLKDDGTGLDRVAGDRIYSGSLTATQEWNYGFNCTVFIAGLGLESNANDHLVNLYPQPENNISLVFGETDPFRFRNEKGYWDFNAGKGVITSIEVNSNSEKPNKIAVSAYPNPFNPATLISYSLPQTGKVSLKVFDLLGRQVAILAEEIKPAGTYQIAFRGDDLSSGIYIVRMESGNKTESIKVILLK
ncbi:MAG: T9SS type A sorting domain-containing protein [Bacteroidetes bacterium]|nr:T9SS type A sorting domain-containing protein [Bacteroidota bacterium]